MRDHGENEEYWVAAKSSMSELSKRYKEALGESLIEFDRGRSGRREFVEEQSQRLYVFDADA